ncbi:copper resistance CopC family protein [Microbacterium deminutum]|uniref:CopC domain-containing protein n=1 Tax=Microbacterium deminutum TaxID=344164 RepID=A0ABP5BMA5_9MICO
MPEKTSSPRFLTRLLIAAAVAVFLSGGGLLMAAPASAHDELVSTDPAADSTVDALPAQLTLTFNEAISTDAGASAVQVTDAAGTSLTAGTPIAQDNVLTQPLEGAASGAIRVLWKVVSADGHPVSGELSFTVSGGTTTPTPTPTATVSPTPTPTETASPSPSTVPDDTGDAGAAVAWIIGGIILAAVLGAITYVLVSRARRERDKAALDAAARSATRNEPPADR